jgi:hypothetical protein
MKTRLLGNFSLLLFISLLAACGGGSECNDFTATMTAPATDPCSDPSPTIPIFDPNQISDPNTNTITNTNKVLLGRFIDSAVEGLRFETPTQSGLTDTNGTFKYVGGEFIRFYIGDILLGESRGFALLNPMNLVPADSNNQQVINILRFVQSLDEDNNPDNGIRIPEIVATQALGQALDFSLSSANFEITANALLTLLTSGSVNKLVDAASAQAHFIASLQAPADVSFTGTAICDDFGGLGEFGCRIVPQATLPPTPLDLALTITDDTASIFAEIENGQHIELIDTDGDLEEMVVAVFVTNNGVDKASVSMRFTLTDENGLPIRYDTTSVISTFTPGYSELVAFGAYPNFQNVSPIRYHGMRIEINVVGGPLTFGEFSQMNIFPLDLSSSVGN